MYAMYVVYMHCANYALFVCAACCFYDENDLYNEKINS